MTNVLHCLLSSDVVYISYMKPLLVAKLNLHFSIFSNQFVANRLYLETSNPQIYYWMSNGTQSYQILGLQDWALQKGWLMSQLQYVICIDYLSHVFDWIIELSEFSQRTLAHFQISITSESLDWDSLDFPAASLCITRWTYIFLTCQWL